MDKVAIAYIQHPINQPGAHREGMVIAITCQQFPGNPSLGPVWILYSVCFESTCRAHMNAINVSLLLLTHIFFSNFVISVCYLCCHVGSVEGISELKLYVKSTWLVY